MIQFASGLSISLAMSAITSQDEFRAGLALDLETQRRRSPPSSERATSSSGEQLRIAPQVIVGELDDVASDRRPSSMPSLRRVGGGWRRVPGPARRRARCVAWREATRRRLRPACLPASPRDDLHTGGRRRSARRHCVRREAASPIADIEEELVADGAREACARRSCAAACAATSA